MTVLISSDSINYNPIHLDGLKKVAERLILLSGHGSSELSIFLTNDSGIKKLNKQYRNKPTPTNVLSFPLQQDGEIKNGTMLGDIVISLDTAAREATERKITIWDRTIRLLIHGLVHLLGYDHERSERDAIIMLEEETKLIEKLAHFHRRKKMPHLAINVDHIATLRQARGINEPDPVIAAGICELAGASGIVVHLREDRRHIQDRDIRILRETIKTKMNLEMGATKEIIKIALDLKPDMITLVPEKRQELTTEGGLNVANQKRKLSKVIAKMSAKNIPVSLFIDPDAKQIKASLDVGATFVEIHTGRYCDAITEEDRNKEFDLVAEAAETAYAAGLRVYAGHGLNYKTTARVAALPTIEELSIGHAVISRAAYVGLDMAVREMLAIVEV